MKINIIGAGPAGLYFGIRMKQLDPRHEIEVYERGAVEDGLGYTLESTLLRELDKIDPAMKLHLRPLVSPQWNGANIYAKDGFANVPFPYTIGIKRSVLLGYLRGLAVESGVKIHDDVSIKPGDVERYRQEADLLVGADGIHSVVRQRYAEAIGASYVQSKNYTIWFKDRNPPNHIRVIINAKDDFPLVATSYPIGRSSEGCTIIECVQDAYFDQEFNRYNDKDGTISAKGMKEIGSIFRDFELQLESVRSRWIHSMVNTAERFNFNNVAIIGEAGFSCHYTLGGGLVLAFFEGDVLAETLHDNCTLADYDRRIRPSIQKSYAQSLQYMHWAERIEEKYRTLDYIALINAFCKKE